MKTLFPLLLAGALVTSPFFFMRRPWAVNLWRRARLFLFAWTIAIFVVALLELAVNWHAIYG